MKLMKKVISIITILIVLSTILFPSQVSAAAKISKSKTTMRVGESTTLKVTGTKEKITWSTSNNKVATVSQVGKVTAKSEGTTSIVAKIGKNKHTCKVTVKGSDAELGIGDKWNVPSKWNLKFTSVKTTDERNQFNDNKPEQVVILTYDYENTGFKGESSGVYFSDINITVYDEKGNEAESYPATISSHPQDLTKKGTKCVGAQIAYGLKTKSKKVTVVIEKNDENLRKHKAQFVLDID